MPNAKVSSPRKPGNIVRNAAMPKTDSVTAFSPCFRTTDPVRVLTRLEMELEAYQWFPRDRVTSALRDKAAATSVAGEMADALSALRTIQGQRWFRGTGGGDKRPIVDPKRWIKLRTAIDVATIELLSLAAEIEWRFPLVVVSTGPGHPVDAMLGIQTFALVAMGLDTAELISQVFAKLWKMPSPSTIVRGKPAANSIRKRWLVERATDSIDVTDQSRFLFLDSIGITRGAAEAHRASTGIELRETTTNLQPLPDKNPDERWEASDPGRVAADFAIARPDAFKRHEKERFLKRSGRGAGALALSAERQVKRPATGKR